MFACARVSRNLEWTIKRGVWIFVMTARVAPSVEGDRGNEENDSRMCEFSKDTIFYSSHRTDIEQSEMML